MQSTGETGSSLDQYSHTTWSSLPSEPRPIVEEEERDGNEEHTLLHGVHDVPPVCLQWLRLVVNWLSSHDIRCLFFPCEPPPNGD